VPELTTQCRLLAEILEEQRMQRRSLQALLDQMALLTMTAMGADSAFFSDPHSVALNNTLPTQLAVAVDVPLAVRLETPSDNAATEKLYASSDTGRPLADMTAGTRRMFFLFPGQQLYAGAGTSSGQHDIIVSTVSMKALRWSRITEAVL